MKTMGFLFKSQQHPEFPSSRPSQYYWAPILLNCCGLELSLKSFCWISRALWIRIFSAPYPEVMAPYELRISLITISTLLVLRHDCLDEKSGLFYNKTNFSLFQCNYSIIFFKYLFWQQRYFLKYCHLRVLIPMIILKTTWPHSGTVTFN